MLSVIVPLFNEEESLGPFYSELKKSLADINQKNEILFIDDGSTDGSLKILKNLVLKDDSIRIFSFRRNRGKAEALNLGFLKAKGEIIITLDSDLEDKSSEIPGLIKKLNERYDMVTG